MIDESTIEWQELPTDDNFGIFKCSCIFESNILDSRRIITGIQFEDSTVTNWYSCKSKQVPLIKLFTHKIDFFTGEISVKDEVEFMPIQPGSRLKMIIKYPWTQNMIAKSYKRLISHKLMFQVKIPSDHYPNMNSAEVSLRAPISYIGLNYNYVKRGISVHPQDCLGLYVKSLKYEKILFH